MTDTEWQAEWHNRTEFQPIAEVLAVDTNQIMSAATDDGGKTWLVFYTLDLECNPQDWIWGAVLWRNPEGILETARRFKFKTIAEFTKTLDSHMEQRMKGEDDD